MSKNISNKKYIKRHINYIDSCINSLKKDITEFIKSKHKNSILYDKCIYQILNNIMYNKRIDIDLSISGIHTIKDIKRIISEWDIIIDGDIIGYIYQEFKHKNSKKSKGQYFTPIEIVDEMIKNSINLIENPLKITILDPACGSGQFLIHIINYLMNLYKQLGIDEFVAKQMMSDSIYGCDIDPVACEIARYNINKIYGFEPTIVNTNFLDIQQTLEAKLIFNSQYDVIIGNPPWGAQFTKMHKIIYKNNYKSAESGLNSFTLFIEQSLNLLKGNGIISFIIPEAYLNIKAHKASRQLLLNNSKIKKIITWGDCFKDVYAPSVTIIINKEKDETKRKNNIVKVVDSKNMKYEKTIPQHYYYTTFNNIFTVTYTKHSINIIEHIESLNYFTLKNKVKFFLGIVTGNNNKFISANKSIHNPDPIIIGKDVSKFKISYSGHYFKYCVHSLQQVANQNLYLNKNKIVYKFIGKKLTFAVENNGYYTLNNVNGFIPLTDEIDTDILVAILNSNLIQYYYQTQFFTVKVLKGNLEKLPIKMVHGEVAKKIKQISLFLKENEDKNMLENLNDIIYSSYNVKDSLAYYIENQLNKKIS